MNKIYPKILIIATSKINLQDSNSNNLLLRNLLSDSWPKDNIAQIYSSGDNGDAGFFRNYYQLSEKDRFFGKLFYDNKRTAADNIVKNNTYSKKSFFSKIKHYFIKILFESGLYEIIFRPKISREMDSWINEFKPDIILGQGYLLTFCFLPIIIKEKYNLKLAIFSTDDWPSYLYSGKRGGTKALTWIIRPVVNYLSKKLYKIADVTFAFGQPMTEVYEKRYNRKFITLNHSDDYKRFNDSKTFRLTPDNVFSIVTTGHFNSYRASLLLDIEKALFHLNSAGIKCHLTVLSHFISEPFKSELNHSKYITFLPDPGNDRLPSFLKGADLLMIVESFDPSYSKAISLSISTKAHLFMFSNRQILIYSDENAGIVQYAKKHEWATIVTSKDSILLADAIRDLSSYPEKYNNLIRNGNHLAEVNHSPTSNRNKFFDSLNRV